MANDGGEKYYEDYILRKEGRSKWIQYWVVIRGVWMLFYSERATTNRDNFRGSIELSSNTKCNIARRGTYSFPFYLSTERGTHLFKCETNLKRHQWMYLIELASKGSPPVPAPLAVPHQPSQHITKDSIPSDGLQGDNTETDKVDLEQDEDDISIPPGVILVTTPIDDLSQIEELSNNHMYSNTTAERAGPVPPLLGRAVLSTGITGTTMVVQKPSSLSSSTKSPSPKVSGSFQLTRSELSMNRKSSHPASFSGELSSQSSNFGGRSNSERPCSSPSPTQLERKHAGRKLTPTTASRGNVRFSRHMAMSAPDIQILTVED